MNFNHFANKFQNEHEVALFVNRVVSLAVVAIAFAVVAIRLVTRYA